MIQGTRNPMARWINCQCLTAASDSAGCHEHRGVEAAAFDELIEVV